MKWDINELITVVLFYILAEQHAGSANSVFKDHWNDKGFLSSVRSYTEGWHGKPSTAHSTSVILHVMVQTEDNRPTETGTVGFFLSSGPWRAAPGHSFTINGTTQWWCLRLKRRPEKCSAAGKVLCNSSPEKDLRDQQKSSAAHRAFVIDGLCLCSRWLSNMYISYSHTPKGSHAFYSVHNICSEQCRAGL